MAESVQEQGLSAGMSEPSKEHGEAVGGRRMKQARPDGAGAGQTQFRGVRRKESGRYGAQIWVPALRANVVLGTFDTAEEAAKAYDSAAVELHASTPGCVEKKQQQKKAVELHPRALGSATTTKKKKKKAAARSDAWTKFRGVYRTANGKYVAQIRHGRGKGRNWLGTFGSAEDAARAYDDAAVKLHGARAVTNFKQPGSEDKDATAETMGVKKEESSTDLLTAFPETPALDSLSRGFISGAQLDDPYADLPPAERQLVDGFLKDTDLSDAAP